MKILNFELDTDLLQVNQNSLIDTMKLAVYDANLELFEQISFENDLAFSEPALFFYFLGKDLCLNVIRPHITRPSKTGSF